MEKNEVKLMVAGGLLVIGTALIVDGISGMVDMFREDKAVYDLDVCLCDITLKKMEWTIEWINSEKCEMTDSDKFARIEEIQKAQASVHDLVGRLSSTKKNRFNRLKIKTATEIDPLNKRIDEIREEVGMYKQK